MGLCDNASCKFSPQPEILKFCKDVIEAYITRLRQLRRPIHVICVTGREFVPIYVFARE